MTDPSLHYTMLFTAQGMGNLISLTRAGSNDVVYTAWVDCGSSSSTIGEVAETVAFMQSYIDRNRKDSPGRAFDIDLLVISHSDDDHWSLIPELLNVYTGTNRLRIKKIAYGNAHGWYTKARGYSNRPTQHGQYNVLTDLAASATIAQEIPVFANTSYFDQLGGVQFDSTMIDGTNFRFVPMCANVLSTRAAYRSVALNTVSICLAVLRSDTKGGFEPLIILPGDMTFETIRFLDGELDGKTLFAGAWVLGCPHHGSRNTIADGYDAAGGSYSFAEWFAEYVETSALAVSAGFTTHRHPYDSVIQLLAVDIGTHEDQHDYISFVTAPTAGYQSTYTDDMIYTNYSDNLRQKAVFDKPYHVEADPFRYVFTITGANFYVMKVSPNAGSQPGQSLELSA